jgi:ketosteroid isomerase-like protein
LKGTDAVRQWVVGLLEQVDAELEYTDSDVKVVGDWAFEQYAAVVTMTPKAGGESMTENVRGIHVYRRGEDGSWKIAHDIWNSDTPHPGSD